MIDRCVGRSRREEGMMETKPILTVADIEANIQRILTHPDFRWGEGGELYPRPVHEEIDAIMHDALRAIAEGRVVDPAALARAALKTDEIDCDAWYG